MKFQTTRLILASAFALATPLLVLAGDKAVPPSGPTQAQSQQYPANFPQALQQGKNTGRSVSDQKISANAYRAQTPEERAYVAQQSDGRSPWNDSAFHK